MCRRVGVDDMMVAIMYSVSTLLASLFLPRMGRYVDTWPVYRMVRLNALFFGSALILFAYANTLITLWISLFFMRLFGQGALTMTATAHTIKRFKQNRGTAIGLTQLGYPLSELVFPSLYLLIQHRMDHATAFLLFGMAIFFSILAVIVVGIHPPPFIAPTLPSLINNASIRLANTTTGSIFFCLHRIIVHPPDYHDRRPLFSTHYF